MLEATDAFVVLATFSIVFIALALLRQNGQKKDDKRRPPSLPSVPFLGSMPFFRGGIENMHQFFMEKAETLGPVFHFYAGNKLAVVLNGREANVDGLLKHAEAFGDRSDFWTEYNIFNINLKGIAFSHSNDIFKRTHKIILSILKEFGFGATKEIELRILEEVEAMMKEIHEQNGRPFYLKFVFAKATGTIMLKILFGRQTTSMIDSNTLVETANEFITSTDPKIDSAPIIRFLPKYRKLMDAMRRAQAQMMEIFEEAIKHSKSDDSEVNFVKRYIEIEGTKYDHENFLYIIRDLILGSADTISTTLQWTSIELANNPDVQTRLQKEIDEVLPDGRLPSLDDRPYLPYTEAVILESLRIHTLSPFGITHRASKDTEVCGYHIPEGCLVFPNLFSANMDPKLRGDPTNFRPERFLDKENKVIGRETVLSFGLGKRACIGETLARQEALLLLTSLVQHFDFRPPEGQNSIEVKVVNTISIRPCPFDVRLIPRRKA